MLGRSVKFPVLSYTKTFSGVAQTWAWPALVIVVPGGGAILNKHPAASPWQMYVFGRIVPCPIDLTSVPHYLCNMSDDVLRMPRTSPHRATPSRQKRHSSTRQS